MSGVSLYYQKHQCVWEIVFQHIVWSCYDTINFHPWGQQRGVFCEYNLCSASVIVVLHVIYYIGLHFNSTWLYIYLTFEMMNKMYAMYNFTLHEMLGFLIHMYSNFVWLPTLTCTRGPVTPYDIINLDHWGHISILKLESELKNCHSKKCNKNVVCKMSAIFSLSHCVKSWFTPI